MNRTMLKIVAVACITLSVPGCSVLKKLGLVQPQGSASWRSRQAESPSLTEIGRTEVEAGNPGLAVATFGKALERGEPRGPALNGLGIAYARLGDEGLAALYFRTAVTVEPENPKYRANLDLLVATARSERLASARAGTLRAPVDSPPVPLAFDKASADGKLVQIAPRQFMIRIVAPTAGTRVQAMAGAQRTNSTGSTGEQQTRIGMARR